jgi:4-alpha-glucanotransferase
VSIDYSKKLAGVLVPVFVLRSASDLGVGDTECVRRMIDWCAAHRLSVLQVLPINETGDDNSPYNAISAMALDPTTIAISPETLPDLSRAAFQSIATPALLKELRRGPIAYRKVKALKQELLRAAFENFLEKHDAANSPRALEFRRFLQAQVEWVADYALFRTLMLQHRNLPVWEEWPAEHRSPSCARGWILSRPPDERHELERNILFFAYV